MILEPNIERCAGEDTGPRGVDWRSHIGWEGKLNISHKGVETTPLKATREQHRLAMGLGGYKWPLKSTDTKIISNWNGQKYVKKLSQAEGKYTIKSSNGI